MSVHHMVSCVCSVLVLSIAVLVLEAIWYSNPAHWFASSCEPPRSTIGIAAVQTAIEYEYDEIRCEARICSFVQGAFEALSLSNNFNACS